MGMSIAEFERMWPKEFFLYVQGYNERKKDEAMERIAQAYITAQWTAQAFAGKRLPDLDKVLKKVEQAAKPKQMSDRDMLAEVKRINAMFGGTVKRESPGKGGE